MAVGPSQWLRRVWFVDKRSRFSVVFHPTFDVRAISKGNKTVSHILQVTTNMVAMFCVAWMAVGPSECLRRVWFVDKQSTFSVVFHPTFDVLVISMGNATVCHILQVTTNMVTLCWEAWMAVGPSQWLCRVWCIDKCSTFWSSLSYFRLGAISWAPQQSPTYYRSLPTWLQCFAWLGWHSEMASFLIVGRLSSYFRRWTHFHGRRNSLPHTTSHYQHG